MRFKTFITEEWGPDNITASDIESTFGYPYAMSGTYFLKPAGGQGSRNQIAGDTHHIVYGNNFKTREATNKKLSDILHERGIKHELSKDENGHSMIYIPKDQREHVTEAKKTITPEEIYGIANPSIATQYRVLPADMSTREDKIGYKKFHKIHTPFDNKRNDSYIQRFSRRLQKLNVKHEISKDEEGRPAIYIPKDQS